MRAGEAAATKPGQNYRQHLNALQILRTHRNQAHTFRTLQLGREVTF